MAFALASTVLYICEVKDICTIVVRKLHIYNKSRGRILGRNWDKSLKSFLPCFSQSPLIADSTPPPLEKKWFETGL
jgi:hypothetical protein